MNGERWNVLDGTPCYTLQCFLFGVPAEFFTSLCISLTFILYLTFQLSVCFQRSRCAMALWSALTQRTPFQRALTTPGDLYKICKDHNKYLKRTFIYRDLPGHIFHYVNCSSNHLHHAFPPFSFLLLPSCFPSVLSPIRLRKCLSEPAWPGHLREQWQQGAISNLFSFIKQWEKTRKVTERWERGKNRGWSWWLFDPGMRNGNKKVAHQRNEQKKMEHGMRRKWKKERNDGIHI